MRGLPTDRLHELQKYGVDTQIFSNILRLFRYLSLQSYKYRRNIEP